MKDLLAHLSESTGQHLDNAHLSSVSGGDINTAYQLQTAQVNWFIKLNQASLADMFAAEAAGLQAIAGTQTIRVPKVIHYGQFKHHAYLILEFIPLSPLRGQSLCLLGEQLASLHQIKQAYFGWQRDNTIGCTAQSNNKHQDWLSFWQQERLAKQLQLAASNGYQGKLQNNGEKLQHQLAYFFSDYHPIPSLLHGDLWAGNAAADTHGQAVIFDPACYFGDRETDIAMTELFGGFGSEFYSAYNSHFPLDSGYKTRKKLYNLYHILNHLNLFGSGYLSQTNAMIESLLAEIR